MKKDYSNFGRLGELSAQEYLKDKGYLILDVNYFFKTESGSKIGEIDIICKDKDSFVFVEVKTTISSEYLAEFFRLERRISRAKIHKIIRTAQHWFQNKELSLDGVSWRIDIIGIINHESSLEVLHFKNAIEDKRF